MFRRALELDGKLEVTYENFEQYCADEIDITPVDPPTITFNFHGNVHDAALNIESTVSEDNFIFSLPSTVHTQPTTTAWRKIVIPVSYNSCFFIEHIKILHTEPFKMMLSSNNDGSTLSDYVSVDPSTANEEIRTFASFIDSSGFVDGDYTSNNSFDGVTGDVSLMSGREYSSQLSVFDEKKQTIHLGLRDSSGNRPLLSSEIMIVVNVDPYKIEIKYANQPTDGSGIEFVDYKPNTTLIAVSNGDSQIINNPTIFELSSAHRTGIIRLGKDVETIKNLPIGNYTEHMFFTATHNGVQVLSRDVEVKLYRTKWTKNICVIPTVIFPKYGSSQWFEYRAKKDSLGGSYAPVKPVTIKYTPPTSYKFTPGNGTYYTDTRSGREAGEDVMIKKCTEYSRSDLSKLFVNSLSLQSVSKLVEITNGSYDSGYFYPELIAGTDTTPAHYLFSARCWLSSGRVRSVPDSIVLPTMLASHCPIVTGTNMRFIISSFNNIYTFGGYSQSWDQYFGAQYGDPVTAGGGGAQYSAPTYTVRPLISEARWESISTRRAAYTSTSSLDKSLRMNVENGYNYCTRGHVRVLFFGYDYDRVPVPTDPDAPPDITTNYDKTKIYNGPGGVSTNRLEWKITPQPGDSPTDYWFRFYEGTPDKYELIAPTNVSLTVTSSHNVIKLSGTTTTHISPS